MTTRKRKLASHSVGEDTENTGTAPTSTNDQQKVTINEQQMVFEEMNDHVVQPSAAKKTKKKGTAAADKTYIWGLKLKEYRGVHSFVDDDWGKRSIKDPFLISRQIPEKLLTTLYTDTRVGKEKTIQEFTLEYAKNAWSATEQRKPNKKPTSESDN